MPQTTDNRIPLTADGFYEITLTIDHTQDYYEEMHWMCNLAVELSPYVGQNASNVCNWEINGKFSRRVCIKLFFSKCWLVTIPVINIVLFLFLFPHLFAWCNQDWACYCAYSYLLFLTVNTTPRSNSPTPIIGIMTADGCAQYTITFVSHKFEWDLWLGWVIWTWPAILAAID